MVQKDDTVINKVTFHEFLSTFPIMSSILAALEQNKQQQQQQRQGTPSMQPVDYSASRISVGDKSATSTVMHDEGANEEETIDYEDVLSLPDDMLKTDTASGYQASPVQMPLSTNPYISIHDTSAPSMTDFFAMRNINLSNSSSVCSSSPSSRRPSITASASALQLIVTAEEGEPMENQNLLHPYQQSSGAGQYKPPRYNYQKRSSLPEVELLNTMSKLTRLDMEIVKTPEVVESSLLTVSDAGSESTAVSSPSTSNASFTQLLSEDRYIPQLQRNKFMTIRRSYKRNSEQPGSPIFEGEVPSPSRRNSSPINVLPHGRRNSSPHTPTSVSPTRRPSGDAFYLLRKNSIASSAGQTLTSQTASIESSLHRRNSLNHHPDSTASSINSMAEVPMNHNFLVNALNMYPYSQQSLLSDASLLSSNSIQNDSMSSFMLDMPRQSTESRQFQQQQPQNAAMNASTLSLAASQQSIYLPPQQSPQPVMQRTQMPPPPRPFNWSYSDGTLLDPYITSQLAPLNFIPLPTHPQSNLPSSASLNFSQLQLQHPPHPSQTNHIGLPQQQQPQQQQQQQQQNPAASLFAHVNQSTSSPSPIEAAIEAHLRAATASASPQIQQTPLPSSMQGTPKQQPSSLSPIEQQILIGSPPPPITTTPFHHSNSTGSIGTPTLTTTTTGSASTRTTATSAPSGTVSFSAFADMTPSSMSFPLMDPATSAAAAAGGTYQVDNTTAGLSLHPQMSHATAVSLLGGAGANEAAGVLGATGKHDLRMTNQGMQGLSTDFNQGAYTAEALSDFVASQLQMQQQQHQQHQQQQQHHHQQQHQQQQHQQQQYQHNHQQRFG
jgi:hypothetical protein